MVKILNVGMNHETAPVELRECLSSVDDIPERAMSMIRECSHIQEGLFLSTCNRVEVFAVVADEEDAFDSIFQLFSEIGNMPGETLEGSLYRHEGSAAVEHLFRVASSLDSMVVGEPQILGQLKEAYRDCARHKTSGVILNRLMHRAFHVAKRIRTETGICEAAVSISYAAVELARKIFHSLEQRKVLLIGAGEMAELAARHLMKVGGEVDVANRTFSRALEVAEKIGAKAVSFEEVNEKLKEVDIVISSTAASGFVLKFDDVKRSVKKRRSRALFFIDIAVPRDVEPRINSLENVYLYDIDDLKGVIRLNMEQRMQEAVRAERIVKEETLKYERWLKTLSVVPTIIDMREKAEELISSELKKSHSALAGLRPEQIRAVETLTRSVAEKLLSDPILFLKGRAGRSTLNLYLDITRKLFNLDRIDKEIHELKQDADAGGDETVSYTHLTLPTN